MLTLALDHLDVIIGLQLTARVISVGPPGLGQALASAAPNSGHVIEVLIQVVHLRGPPLLRTVPRRNSS